MAADELWGHGEVGDRGGEGVKVCAEALADGGRFAASATVVAAVLLEEAPALATVVGIVVAIVVGIVVGIVVLVAGVSSGAGAVVRWCAPASVSSRICVCAAIQTPPARPAASAPAASSDPQLRVLGIVTDSASWSAV